MENCPHVKGWRPFKSVGSDLAKKELHELKKQKQKDAYLNKSNKCEMLEVPKDWKTPLFTVDDNPHKRLFASTEFEVLFPSKLASYLKEVFPLAQRTLAAQYIKAELTLNEGSMKVSTTVKTFDPVMILRAHSVVRLLARYVPVEEAVRVLDDEVFEDIITIGHHKRDTFHRRRGRLSDPSIVELVYEVLQCRMYIAGKTVAAVGSYSALNQVRSLVLDCVERNIHPIYTLKRLQVIHKLSSMPEMAGLDWKPFLPPVPKKNVKRKAPHKVRHKKTDADGGYCAFPPAQPPSKVDLELEAGVFHLKYTKVGGRYVAADSVEKADGAGAKRHHGPGGQPKKAAKRAKADSE